MRDIGRVPPLFALERVLRQRRLDLYNCLGAGRGPLRRVARELQHLRHMLGVLLAQLRRVRVVLDVVVAIWEPETTLAKRRDHLRGVLEVRGRAKAEERTNADRVQESDDGGDVVLGPDGCDTRELRLERLQAVRLDRRFVHAARVVVADLAHVRTAR